MQTKAPHPADLLAGRSIQPLIAFYYELCQLKQLFRQGWLKRGVPESRCESVAEHSFGVAVLAMFLAEAHFPDLDGARIMRLALLHDFGEIYAGDLTPEDAGAQEKTRKERQSATQVLGKLPAGAKYLALWEEFQDGSSPEARLVREIDKLEMAMQASVYEHFGLADLRAFHASARKAIASPPLQALLTELAAVE